MADKKEIFGNGWENQYGGVRVSVNLEQLNMLPVDKYGNVSLFVQKRKSPDEKSKATHFVKENKPKEEAPF
jgi:hypothetical protein